MAITLSIPPSDFATQEDADIALRNVEQRLEAWIEHHRIAWRRTRDPYGETARRHNNCVGNYSLLLDELKLVRRFIDVT